MNDFADWKNNDPFAGKPNDGRIGPKPIKGKVNPLVDKIVAFNPKSENYGEVANYLLAIPEAHRDKFIKTMTSDMTPEQQQKLTAAIQGGRMGDIFDQISPDKPAPKSAANDDWKNENPFKDWKNNDPFAGKPAAPAKGDIFDEIAPTKPQGKWSKFKQGATEFADKGGKIAFDTITEPFKIAGEAIAAPVNALAKAGKGLYGAGVMADNLLSGESLDTALQAGTKAIGNRNPIQSPLGQSKTSQFLGEKVIQPAVNKLSQATGQPELVEGLTEAAGDIASLAGVKPGIKAAAGTGKNLLGKLPDSGLPYTNPEKLYGSAVKLPLTKAWTKQLGEEGATKRSAAVKAGLEGEVPISELGIEKAKGIEKSYRSVVDSVIQQLDQKGTLIPKKQLRAGLGDAYDTAITEGTPKAMAIVDRLYDRRFEKMGQMVKVGEKEIPGQPAVYKPGVAGERVQVSPEVPARMEPVMERQYSPSEVQTIKRHLYKKENYEKAKLSRGLGSQLKEMGNKGMAHEAKVALEDMHPELKVLNKQDAAYINLIEALERAVPRIQNKDMVGLGAKVLLTGSHPWTAILEHTLGLPSVKAKLAFTLNKARKRGNVPVGADAAKAGAYSAPVATKWQSIGTDDDQPEKWQSIGTE